MTDYKAFISYKHDILSRERAIAIERALKRYAKPFFKPPIKIFRDEKILVPNTDLGLEIKKALDHSDYFIFLATPESANSIWCQKEVEYWCHDLKRTKDLILIVLDGTIETNDVADTIVWQKTNCLPPVLSNHITNIPFYVDLREYDSEKMVLENPKFKEIINSISAKLRNTTPEEINDEEIKTHRKNNRLRRNAIVLLSTLLIAFIIASVYAFIVSSINKKEALGNSLFSRGLIWQKDDPTKAIYLLNEARKISNDSSINFYLFEYYRDENFYKKNIKTQDFIQDLATLNNNLIAASKDTITFYDFNGKKLLEKDATQNRIRDIIPHKSGNYFYTLAQDSTLVKWDLEGKTLGTYKHTSLISELDISPKGTIALIDREAGGKTVRIYDSDFNFKQEYPINEGYILSLQFHPKTDSIIALANGHNVFTSTKYNHINILDIANETPEELSTNYPPSIVRFSKSGKYLASAGIAQNDVGTSEITVFNFDTREVIGNFEAHGFNIDALEFSPDERKLLSSSLNGEVKMWSLEGELLDEFRSKRNSLAFAPIAFNGDGTAIATSGSSQKGIKIWNNSNNTLELLYPDRFLTGLQVSPSGKYSLSSYFGPEDKLILRDMDNNKILSRFKDDDIHDYDFITDSIFYTNKEDELLFYNRATKKITGSIKEVQVIKKMPSTMEVLILNKTGELFLYHADTKEKQFIEIDTDSTSNVVNLEMSKDRNYLALVFEDFTTIYENGENGYMALTDNDLHKDFKAFAHEKDTYIAYRDNKIIISKVSGEILNQFSVDNLKEVQSAPNLPLLYTSAGIIDKGMMTKFSIYDFEGNLYGEHTGKYPDDAHLFDVSDNGDFYILTTETGMKDSRVRLYNNVLPIDTFFERKMVQEFPAIVKKVKNQN